MQISVGDKNFRVRIVNLLDDGGDGIIQLDRRNMAALAGQNFQSALRVDSGKDGVFDAGQLHGLQQLLKVLAVLVHGKRVVFRFLQIRRVQPDKERFPLLRNRETLQVCLGGRRQALVEYLRNSGAGRPFRNDGRGLGGLFRSDVLFFFPGLRRRQLHGAFGSASFCGLGFCLRIFPLLRLGKLGQGNGSAAFRFLLQLGNRGLVFGLRFLSGVGQIGLILSVRGILCLFARSGGSIIRPFLFGIFGRFRPDAFGRGFGLLDILCGGLLLFGSFRLPSFLGNRRGRVLHRLCVLFRVCRAEALDGCIRFFVLVSGGPVRLIFALN